MNEVTCKSVINGWQSEENGTLFGPAFNKTTDLWNWQAENLPKLEAAQALMAEHGHSLSLAECYRIAELVQG